MWMVIALLGWIIAEAVWLAKPGHKIQTIKGLLAGIALLIALLFGLILFVKAFQANTVMFALLWIVAPVFACFLHRHSISACFTLRGLRRLRTVLLVVVIAISFVMFIARDDLRNQLGKHYVEGYRHWQVEANPDDPEIDDYGRTQRPSDKWTAKSQTGRFCLTVFDFLMLGAVFGFPAITWKACESAINKAERNRIEIQRN